MARVPGSRPLSTRPDFSSDTPINSSVIPSISLLSSFSTHGDGSGRVHAAGLELEEERLRARRHRLWTKSPLSRDSLQGHTIAAEYWSPSGCVSPPRRRGKDTDFLRLTPSGSLPGNLPLDISQGNHEDSDVQGSFMYQIRQHPTEHAVMPFPTASFPFPSVPTMRSRNRHSHSPYVSNNNSARAPISTTSFWTTYSNKDLHKIDARKQSRECQVPTSQSLPLPHNEIPRLRSGAIDIDDVYEDVERNDQPLNNDSTISKDRQRVSHFVIPSTASTPSHHVYPCSSFEFESQSNQGYDALGFQLRSHPTSSSSSQSSLGIPLVKPGIRSSTSSSPPFFSHPPFHRSILPSSSYSTSPTDSFSDTNSSSLRPYYHFMGTIGQGSYGKVLLGYRDDNPNQELCAVKVMPKRHIRRFGANEVAKELTTLRLVAQTMQSACNEDGERNAPSCRMGGDKEGIQFLQKLVETFQDPQFIFIALEYHPTSLASPETASRFRLAEMDSFSSPNLPISVSLPTSPFSSPTSTRFAHGRIINALRLLAAELTLGLLFLHRHGVVHQDLKPANIMISAEGHAVIGDFGAATALPVLSEEHEQHLPRYGPIVLQPEDTVIFTPLYAAPEILERNNQGFLIYDERIDWWSLGVLLYELSTGDAPFRLTGGGSNGPLRRSDGDASLVYGLLEKLSTVGIRLKQDPHFSRFIKDLLVQDPDYRLSGPAVKLHPFYDPIQDCWEDILALQCPPCPNPLVSPIDASDTSIHFTPSQGHFVMDDPGNKQDTEDSHSGSHSSATLSSSRSVSPTSSHLGATTTTKTAASDLSLVRQAEHGQVGSDGNRANGYTTPTNPLDVDSLFSGAGLRETQLRKVDNLLYNCEQQHPHHQPSDDQASFLDLSPIPSYRDRVVVSPPASPTFLSSPITRRSSSCWQLYPLSSSPKPRSLSPSPPPSPSHLFTVSRTAGQSIGYGRGHRYGHHYGYHQGYGKYPSRGSNSAPSLTSGASASGQFEQTWLGGLADVFEEDEDEMGLGEGIARTTEIKRGGVRLTEDEEREPWFDDSGIGFCPLTTPPRHKKSNTSPSLRPVGRRKEVETNTDAGTMAARGASSVDPALDLYDSRRGSMHYDYDSQSCSEYGVWIGDEDQDHEYASYSDDERQYVDETREDENQGQFIDEVESEGEGGEEEVRPNDSISAQTMAELPDSAIATPGNCHSLGSSHRDGSSGSCPRDSPGQEKPRQKHSERHQDHDRRRGLNSNRYSVLRSEFNDSGLFIPVDLGIEGTSATGVAGGSGTNGATFPGLVVSRHIYDQLEASLDQEDGWAGCSQQLSVLAEQVTRLRSGVGATTKTRSRGTAELMRDSSSEGISLESNENDVSTTRGRVPGSRVVGEGSVIDSSLSSSGAANVYDEFPTELRNLEPQLWDPRRRRRFEKNIEVVFNSPDTPGPTVNIDTDAGGREAEVRRRSDDRRKVSSITENPLQIEKYDRSVNKKKQVPVHAREWTLEEKITISVLEAMDRRDRRIGESQRQQQQHPHHHYHHHHHHVHHHHHHYHHDHNTTKSKSNGLAIAAHICDCPQCIPPSLRSCTPTSFNSSSLYTSSSSGSTSGWARRYNAAAHMFYRFGAPSPGVEDDYSSNSAEGRGRFWGLKKGMKLMKFKQRKEVLTSQARQVVKRAWKKVTFW